ncbi:Lipopolysaccharide-assembly [Hymenobacter gelipurpurascens]|uniref:Lipopolysaccharide-assembly n=1 Tax=Hymenobacter gelipurpurascens TaxID=89968 RepID=A0A212T7K0_9BACT|nr:LptE family protein [Hymenobacter gelipurpurascens]SNC62012.1 Lipopolysaccharide-assembly [Hymenobacter gelipurpurascens]
MTSNKRNAGLPSWLVACFLLLLSLSGCSVYSFSGTNISPEIQTISISTFQNNANNGPSFLAQRFTEDFKDYFQRNTTLKQQARDGDLQFEGQIIAFDFAPAAIQQQNNQDIAGVNRLTIQVRVKYTNTKDPKQDFEQTFQSTRDFPASRDISSINNDPAALREVFRNIITDTFNKSVANW